jgi:tetratricopeptide (TPR) repeat protein
VLAPIEREADNHPILRESDCMYQMDLQRAERCANDRQLGEAEKICESVLAEHPDNVEALRIMAGVRLRQKDSDGSLGYSEHALRVDPENAKVLNLRGRARNNKGELDGAEHDFRHAIALDPRFADAHNNLGHILRRRGQVEQAEICFRRALELKPDHGLANLNQGAIYFERGKIRKAIIHLQRGLDEEMTHVPGRYNLAIALHQVGLLDEAVHNYRQVIAYGEERPEVFCNLAAALQALGEIDGAAAGFEEALRVAPGYGPALAGLAGLLETAREYERGIELLMPHLKRGGASPMVHVAYAQLLRRLDRRQEALVHLAPLAGREGLTWEERSPIHFTLGDLLDDLGEYERAFAHYRRANDLKEVDYGRKRRVREVDALLSVFTPENMRRMPRSPLLSRRPVFIIGMPRSGTSLVEQILASHPEVYGAGELRDVGLLAVQLGRNEERVPYPEVLLRVEEGELRRLSREYLSKMRRTAPKAARFTDKMWQNFEHLGLIELLFPQARVIHCRRDPIDTCLSCFQQSFGTAGPPFTYSLDHIAGYYIEYRRLMKHWDSICNMRVLEVDYETLVAEPEAQSRRLVDFIELEWDDACLKFYENPRIVRTASYAQVRQPVYQSSVGRWKNYAEQLQPLIETLQEAGYVDRA